MHWCLFWRCPGVLGSFILALVYQVLANGLVGTVVGGAVGTLAPHYLNIGATIGDLNLTFLLASGYTMICMFQRMNDSEARES